MKKILITGGAGFIGFHLAKHLLDGTSKIIIADNFFRGENDDDFKTLLNNQNVELIEGDLTQMSAWEALGGGYDHVYHLAAVNGTKNFYKIPHEVLRIDLLTSINAVEWMRKYNPAGKILFTSTSEIYSGVREAFDKLVIPTPENVPIVIPDIFNSRWSYASTKVVGEQLFIHYSSAYGFPFVIVRPSNFYGPREGFDHIIPETIMRALNHEEPFVIYGHQDKRSYCYIDDAVSALKLIMESNKSAGQIYHVGSQEEAKPSYIAEAVFSELGWRPNKIQIADSPPGSVTRRVPDTSKIERDINWKASTSLVDGIKETVEWYVSYFNRQARG